MIILRLTAMVVAIGLMGAAVSRAAGEEVLRAPSMEPLYKVDAKYPPAALRHRIQGTVRLEALIGQDGHSERLRLLSGHPLLVRAAREAARQWVCRPTLRHGKPVRVVTEIDVQFQLDSDGNPPKAEVRGGATVSSGRCGTCPDAGEGRMQQVEVRSAPLPSASHNG
jgi:TonB family protein